MPVSKRCAAAKGREAGKRARAAAAQPAVEPEVEPEEPEEEPAAEEPHTLSPVRFKIGSVEWLLVKRALNQWTYAVTLWKAEQEQERVQAEYDEIDARYAKKEEENEARYAKEVEEMEARHAEPLPWHGGPAVCVCVCGKCRKGGVSPLASPLGSRSVATFNAKV